MAVAVGTITEAESSSTSSLSFAHEAAGANRGLIVGVASYNAEPTGVTFDSVAMTKEGSIKNTTNNDWTSLWSLIAPNTGTGKNVVVSFAAAEEVVAGAVSFTGVNQTDMANTYASGTGNTTAPSLTVTSEADAIVIDTLGFFNMDSASADTPQTERWKQINLNAFESGMGSTKAGASPSVTMSWTINSAVQWTYSAISVTPAAGAAVAAPMRVRQLALTGIGM